MHFQDEMAHLFFIKDEIFRSQNFKALPFIHCFLHLKLFAVIILLTKTHWGSITCNERNRLLFLRGDVMSKCKTDHINNVFFLYKYKLYI